MKAMEHAAPILDLIDEKWLGPDGITSMGVFPNLAVFY